MSRIVTVSCDKPSWLQPRHRKLMTRVLRAMHRRAQGGHSHPRRQLHRWLARRLAGGSARRQPCRRRRRRVARHPGAAAAAELCDRRRRGMRGAAAGAAPCGGICSGRLGVNAATMQEALADLSPQHGGQQLMQP